MRLPPFQVLVDAHGARLGRFLAAQVGAQEAEDCLQETLLAALRAYPHLGDDSNLEGWLFAIARRKALDAHRRRRRRSAAPLDEAPEPAREDPEPWEPGLWARVGTLPRRQRAAVALRFACDLSYAEIAALDGGSEQAARRNVHAALTTLRKELAR